MNDIAINLQSISKKYGDTYAVQDLSLEIEKGEIFGLLGPNGAGKTTIIHMITGLLSPSSGSNSLFGLDPRKDAKAVRQMIGTVAQETNLYDDLTAIENMEHHAALYCKSLKGIRNEIESQLERMTLLKRSHEPVRNFSGGMKRRLALARALLHDPQIIFFDEPTLGVDVQARHVLWDHIHTQKEAGKTFVVSTNDMNEAEALCDRLAILDHGKLIALDKPEELKKSLGNDAILIQTKPEIENPENLFTGLDLKITIQQDHVIRLETPRAEEKVGEILNRVSSEYEILSLSMSKPSLDDVFLHYTGRGLRE
ncbi:MAG: ATP-binding cassette domain-containing protein [Anaerolineales bacterium]|nr:ATP-binding cassette domain-containing protein [Anaerolineales bacterium]